MFVKFASAMTSLFPGPNELKMTPTLPLLLFPRKRVNDMESFEHCCQNCISFQGYVNCFFFRSQNLTVLDLLKPRVIIKMIFTVYSRVYFIHPFYYE